MKSILSIATITFILISHFALAQPSIIPSNDTNAPNIEFENDVLDYGSIPFDANGIREFKIKNTGKAPLTISNVSGECGCTTAVIDGKQGWPQEPILPGKSAIIKVKYDTKRVGAFDKKVTVVSNAKLASMVVKIKGIVLPQEGNQNNNTAPKIAAPKETKSLTKKQGS